MKNYFVAFLAAAALTATIGCEPSSDSPSAGESSSTSAVSDQQGENLTLVSLKLPRVS